MNKKQLIEFLKPFDDDVKVVVRGASKYLMAPVIYELSYVPENEYHAGLVAINIKSSACVDTGVSG